MTWIEWYNSLEKPNWTPEPSTIGFVWQCLYKNIEDVMNAQSDLVEIVSRFDPKIVKMCDDGSKAED